MQRGHVLFNVNRLAKLQSVHDVRLTNLPLQNFASNLGSSTLCGQLPHLKSD
jgi:hypothetical protein